MQNTSISSGEGFQKSPEQEPQIEYHIGDIVELKSGIHIGDEPNIHLLVEPVSNNPFHPEGPSVNAISLDSEGNGISVGGTILVSDIERRIDTRDQEQVIDIITKSYERLGYPLSRERTTEIISNYYD